MIDTSSNPGPEAERLKAVLRYQVLDTPPDGAFDRITALAARRFGVPISIISIVDEDRIWFKSRHGVGIDQIGRDPGLCASAILSNDPYVLPDASVDPRSLANPLVAGDFGLRFYAGVPLTTADGHNLGTLCVIDKQARPVDQAQIEDLQDLASMVVDQLELRLAARQAQARADLMAKEIDHRVMNSLQFVSSLLAMQGKSADQDGTRAHLQQAAARVAAVAQIHRHFTTSGETDEISGLAFLTRLCATLETALDCEIAVEGDEVLLPASSIQSIGLLANELITNAVKHGEGKVRVVFRSAGGKHKLAVCDEGRNLPDGFDPRNNPRSLGMRVVDSLARQLNGSVAASRGDDGTTCFEVAFS